MDPIAIALIAVLAIVVIAAAYMWWRRRHRKLGDPVPGRVWGYPGSHGADTKGGTQGACAALCQAKTACLGYNYLPGDPSLCYLVMPGDFEKYSLCVSKKAGDIGWWDQSRINANLMARKECASS